MYSLQARSQAIDTVRQRPYATRIQLTGIPLKAFVTLEERGR